MLIASDYMEYIGNSLQLAPQMSQPTAMPEVDHDLPQEVLLEIIYHVQSEHLHDATSPIFSPVSEPGKSWQALQDRQRILTRIVMVNRSWNRAFTHLLYQMVFINSDLHFHLFRRTLDQSPTTRAFIKYIGIEPQRGYHEDPQPLSSSSSSFFGLGLLSEHRRKHSYLLKLQKSISAILQFCTSLVHVSVDFTRLNEVTKNAGVTFMNGPIPLPKGYTSSVRHLTIRIQGNIFPVNDPISHSHFGDLESLTFYDTYITDSPPIFSDLGRVHTLKIVDTSFSSVRTLFCSDGLSGITTLVIRSTSPRSSHFSMSDLQDLINLRDLYLSGSSETSAFTRYAISGDPSLPVSIQHLTLDFLPAQTPIFHAERWKIPSHIKTICLMLPSDNYYTIQNVTNVRECLESNFPRRRIPFRAPMGLTIILSPLYPNSRWKPSSRTVDEYMDLEREWFFRNSVQLKVHFRC
ncbi:hypothetical protein C8Q75DRAFT_763257 [Abortiporus biennis]|nr:hypothetical protein C8Q75DRAFT_763257 [Abortiporus biennis]